MRKKKENGLRKIAEMTGVSPATVSRALNNSDLISPDTKNRILETVRTLGKLPDVRLKTIALVLPEDMEIRGYTLRLMEEIRKEAYRRGKCLEIVFADGLNVLSERSVIGVISIDYHNRIAKHWKNSSVPIVCVNDAALSLEGIHAVYSDERSSIATCVNTLIGFGHKRIGLFQLGPKNVYCSKRREECFFESGRAYGLENSFFSEWGCVPVRNNLSPEAVDGPLSNLLAQRITALIVPGESAHYNVLDFLNRRKIAVPRKLSLMCWEALDSRYLTPPLTTVEQNFQELASAAFDVLEAQIGKERIPLHREIAYKINLRSSIAVPKRQNK